jgi:hypothetical protein
MDTLQRTVNKTLEELPLTILSTLLDGKLREQDVKLSKRKLVELSKRLLDAKTDTITFGSGKNVLIEFTDEDAERVSARAEKFLKELPDLIKTLSDKTAVDVLTLLKRRWRKEAALQRRDINAFRKRLEKRWGGGMEPLRMLVTIAREFAAGMNNGPGSASGGDRPQTFDVLIKLYVRACQVADEILCLLGGGFADGAMARWRTLHEITSVAFLIEQEGEELAERYTAHQVVESRKAARQYEEYRERLGLTPMDAADLQQIEKDYAALVAKYGNDFGSDQGWAAKTLSIQRPKISDIQRAARLDHLGPYYRMASHSVHANPKGVFFKLGLIGDELTMLAGPSNAGLADPGYATALSMAQISSTLLPLYPTMDNNIAVRIMLILTDEVGEQMSAAHEQLEKDDEAYRGRKS